MLVLFLAFFGELQKNVLNKSLNELLILYKYWNTRDELDLLPKVQASLDLVKNNV